MIWDLVDELEAIEYLNLTVDDGGDYVELVERILDGDGPEGLAVTVDGRIVAVYEDEYDDLLAEAEATQTYRAVRNADIRREQVSRARINQMQEGA